MYHDERESLPEESGKNLNFSAAGCIFVIMKVITMKMPRDFSGNVGREIWNFFIITIGCAVAGLGLSLFVIPNRIAPGGITGLATVIYHWIGWPVGITALALNIPLFLMSLRIIGSAFCIRTIMATFLLSLFIDLFAGITPITDDLLLAVIAGGGMMGLGYGLVFRRNATTGGTDLMARIVHNHFSWLSIAQVLTAIDVLVVLTAAAAFRSYELPLYAAVTVLINTKVIDTVSVGINFSKAAHIISSRPDEVAARLMDELDRGVTGLSARGLYTGGTKEVLVCVLTARQVPSLRRIVKDTDPGAFVYISETREVFGQGFQPHN